MNNKICECKGGLEYPHNNLRTVTAMNKLIENLSNVPIEKIEELTKDL